MSRYIEKKLEEALKEDKGTGCEIPQLDPFAKEVTQFDKTFPKIKCPGKDWVRCYVSIQPLSNLTYLQAVEIDRTGT